jgi:hypothetical protein
MKNIRLLLVVFAIFLLTFISTSEAAGKKSKEKEPDPKDCEVCISNLEAIDRLVPAGKKSDKLTIEKAITTHCTLSGFGSEWKPNPNLGSPKDVKMCYIFDPIKKSVSQPFATGMPKKKVCERLKKDNPDICAIKYRKLFPFFSSFLVLISSLRLFLLIAIKVEKKEGEKVDYNKMKVKELKTLLTQRGVQCVGCSEKSDFVKKCQETEHMDL